MASKDYRASAPVISSKAKKTNNLEEVAECVLNVGIDLKIHFISAAILKDD